MKVVRVANLDRRSFVQLALAMGAVVAWGDALGVPSRVAWQERRDLYPEGVASGDPDSNSVQLWTRRSPDTQPVDRLHVEVAEDASFHHVVANTEARISAASDWTCRVLVGGLKPDKILLVSLHG
jgi:alkaline phosphatase D